MPAAGHPVNRVDAVELESIDDEMKAIRQFLLRFACRRARLWRLRFDRCLSHWSLR